MTTAIWVTIVALVFVLGLAVLVWRSRRSVKKPSAVVSIELSPEQQRKLREATQGEFTAATFTFTAGPIRPPEHRVGCTLVRVDPTLKPRREG